MPPTRNNAGVDRGQLRLQRVQERAGNLAFTIDEANQHLGAMCPDFVRSVSRDDDGAAWKPACTRLSYMQRARQSEYQLNTVMRVLA